MQAGRDRTLFVARVRRLLYDVAPLHAISAALCLWRNGVASEVEAAHVLPALRAFGTVRARRPALAARAGGPGRLR